MLKHIEMLHGIQRRRSLDVSHMSGQTRLPPQ
jgi:hypothetical protein